MIDWLFGTVLGKCVMTFLISLLPVVELRGGIPYGISQGLDPWLAFAASTLGNMLPVPFLLLFVRKILHWMKRYPRLGHLAVSLERRADRKSSRVRKSELVGLCILVAIPLPGTGAWTGALVAALMEMRLKRALPAIYAGVLIGRSARDARPDRREGPALSRLTRPKGAAMKRTDYISWDEYFMGVALLAAAAARTRTRRSAPASSRRRTSFSLPVITACPAAAATTFFRGSARARRQSIPMSSTRS